MHDFSFLRDVIRLKCALYVSCPVTQIFYIIFSVTLYSAHSRVGSGNLMLCHFVPHFQNYGNKAKAYQQGIYGTQHNA